MILTFCRLRMNILICMYLRLRSLNNSPHRNPLSLGYAALPPLRGGGEREREVFCQGQSRGRERCRKGDRGCLLNNWWLTLWEFKSPSLRMGFKLDAAIQYQLGFQDAASPVMEGIINFHNYVMVYLTFTIIGCY